MFGGSPQNAPLRIQVDQARGRGVGDSVRVELRDEPMLRPLKKDFLLPRDQIAFYLSPVNGTLAQLVVDLVGQQPQRPAVTPALALCKPLQGMVRLSPANVGSRGSGSLVSGTAWRGGGLLARTFECKNKV